MPNSYTYRIYIVCVLELKFFYSFSKVLVFRDLNQTFRKRGKLVVCAQVTRERDVISNNLRKMVAPFPAKHLSMSLERLDGEGNPQLL